MNVLSRTLGEAANSSREMRFLHRLHCVLLVKQGHSGRQVADWFNHDSSTVIRWVRHFKRFGVLGLYDDEKPGRPSRLNVDDLDKLKHELGRVPRSWGYRADSWNGRLLARHLEKEYGVRMSVRQCQRLRRQLLQPDTDAVGVAAEVSSKP